ncbi:F0F1 ATP synthase subunit alpha [Patescibacteria group bacterium]|nr:F0F1 ATP synthase subunit alpha [Patescibacteria group bacterium]
MPKSDIFANLYSIKEADLKVSQSSVGKVISYADGIVFTDQLEDVQSGELVTFGENAYGLALNLEKEKVGIIVLSGGEQIRPGDLVHRTGKILSINVSEDIIGRVINAMGNAIDGKADIARGKDMFLEKIAPGVIDREAVNQPMQTGIKAVDALIPIGRGQRELIIGDRNTGKSSVALGSILNQKGQDMICVYVSIGQKKSTLAQFIQVLEDKGAMEYTIVVAASASDAASLQFLAPYAGQAVAEYFLDKGKDVLIVFDDLSKHAQAYREISLLLKRPSGREAYPGDVFYLHSRLLERSCKLNQEHGGGSITALPIIETQANDVSAYIPTNVISITDGQIYLETDLFNSGVRPAINVGLSVSRVGSAAQVKAMKQVAGSLKLDLAQFRELEAFAQFSSDLDATTKKQLERGKRVSEILKQAWDLQMSVADQVLMIYAAVNGFLDEIEIAQLTEWEQSYLNFAKSKHAKLVSTLSTGPKIEKQEAEALQKLVKDFAKSYPHFYKKES